jgi:hypothetical protein
VRWFSAGRSPAGPDEPRGHRSPALKALLDGLHPEKRPTVLDLGAPLADNVAFLSALACRVRIADLYRAFGAEAAESGGEPEPAAALLDRVLPLAPGERFDAVLAWDLFDFLRADQLSALMDRLTPACVPGARFLLLASVHRQLPGVPPRYRILDRETLAVEAPPGGAAHERARGPARDARTREQPDLRRLMRGFFVGHSLLLRSGVHEYLFVRDAQGPEGTGTTARARAGWSRRGTY